MMTPDKVLFLVILVAIAIAVALFILSRDYATEESKDRSRKQDPMLVGATSPKASRSSSAQRFNDDTSIRSVHLTQVKPIDRPPPDRRLTFTPDNITSFRLPSGKYLKLQTDEKLLIVSIEPNPEDSLFLVNHGGGRYRIYNQDGTWIRSLPTAAEALPELASKGDLYWTWGPSGIFVATMEMYAEPDPASPRDPNTITAPYDLRLFSYNPDTGNVTELKVANSDNLEWVLRLDGITADGALIISQAPRESDYWNPGKGKFLGFFPVPER